MKKFLQSIPLAAIIFLVFAMISFVWGSDQKRMAGVDEGIEIAELNSKSEFGDCEGEYAYVTGTPTVTETPSDPLFKVKTDGFVLVRTVEMYQYTIVDDEVYKQFSSFQNNDIKGKHGENHVNPSFPTDVKNAVFFGKMAVGKNNIPVSEAFIDALRLKKSSVSNVLELKDIENIQIPGYKSCGDGYFTKADPNNWKIGDIRVKFSYLPADTVKEVTVCGIVKNGVITTEESNFSYISDSIKDISSIITEIRGNHGRDASELFTAGIIEIAIAVIIYVVSIIKSRNIKSRRV